MAKITLNLDMCVACGSCITACSQMFEMDMSTLKVALKAGKREGDLWTLETADVECAKRAAGGCLMKAISVEE
ncbi:MAG: ferredoxin [Parcubacteria group bacterium]